jgi:hypothetical protein
MHAAASRSGHPRGRIIHASTGAAEARRVKTKELKGAHRPVDAQPEHIV